MQKQKVNRGTWISTSKRYACDHSYLQFWLGDQISPLHLKSLSSPQSPYALPIPSRISQLFSRDARHFARSLPSSHNPAYDIEGPVLSWRPPNISYELEFPALSPSCSHPFHPKHVKTYFETISFIFKTSAPDSADEHTQAGLLWREYRKQIALRKDCLKLSILMYHATADCVDMIIGWCFFYSNSEWRFCSHILPLEWDNLEDSKNCHASPEVSSAREALTPHLAMEHQPAPSSGYPFYPDSELKYAEMVDFKLSSAASQTDRRALEYYLRHFHG